MSAFKDWINLQIVYRNFGSRSLEVVIAIMAGLIGAVFVWFWLAGALQ